jgi:hypothetical protein
LQTYLQLLDVVVYPWIVVILFVVVFVVDVISVVLDVTGIAMVVLPLEKVQRGLVVVLANGVGVMKGEVVDVVFVMPVAFTSSGSLLATFAIVVLTSGVGVMKFEVVDVIVDGDSSMGGSSDRT